MPLWKRLAIILSGVLLVVTVAIARVEYLPQISPEPPAQDNYAAEIYQRYLESLKASLLLAREWIGESFGNFVEVIERNDEFVVAMSTVLIAVFTIILGVATWLLWRATKKLVRGAEETAKRQLRAYISYKGGHFIDIDVAAFAANKIPQCELILINQGKTPAKNLKIYQRAWVTANPEFTTNPDFFLIAPFEESFREGTMRLLSLNTSKLGVSFIGPPFTSLMMMFLGNIISINLAVPPP
jgi:hypothetical protein